MTSGKRVCVCVASVVTLAPFSYSELRCTQLGGDCNNICASATLCAFGGSSASSLSLLKVSDVGKRGNGVLPTISGHSKPISSLNFSPLDDSLLATGGEDALAKVLFSFFGGCS